MTDHPETTAITAGRRFSGDSLAPVLFPSTAYEVASVDPELPTFWRRVEQGFAILGDRKRYLRTVVTWQAADWCFRILGLVFFLVENVQFLYVVIHLAQVKDERETITKALSFFSSCPTGCLWPGSTVTTSSGNS